VLAKQLATLREETAVSVLIIPVTVEGRYGHASAQQALGPRQQTSHVLDLGGGSMQVAGHDRSFGVELGQKSWSRLLCQTLNQSAGESCHLLPLQALQLQQARDLADQQLHGLSAEEGGGTLRAISRPVTRGIRSALRGMGMGMAQGDAFSLQEPSAAIDSLSTLPLADLVVLPQLPANFAPYIVSDMLLVEGC